jgi:hypothetical protein
MVSVRLSSLVIAAMFAFLLAAGPAGATAPGANGKIGFVDYGGRAWTVNPDGSGQTALPPTSRPGRPLAGFFEWSPDGTRFLDAFVSCDPEDGFCEYAFVTFAADGTDERPVATSGLPRGMVWSNDGRRLVYSKSTQSGSEIWSVGLDGSNDHQVGRAGLAFTGWSPDGSVMYSGTGTHIRCETLDPVRPCTFESTPGSGSASWSPDASRIVFARERPGRLGERDIYVLHRATGTVQQLTDHAADDYVPVWSPDGKKIAFVSVRDDPNSATCNVCSSALYVVNADGSDETRVSSVFGGQIQGIDWQPLPVTTPSSHQRPFVAGEVQLSLVPAYVECTAPDRQHGPPLAAGSCSNPSTPSIRVVAGQYNPVPAPDKSVGHLRLAVTEGAAGAPDDSDVRLRFRVTNVMYGSYLTDYTGEILVAVPLQVTDKEVGVSKTVQNYPLRFKAACTATPDETIGATCERTTTADAILPGSVPEGRRSVWEVDQVRVFDGGADFNVDTAPNDVFLTQGLFIP